MKIELIKLEKFGEQDWYCLKIDGLSLAYENTEEKANELYQKLINDPSLLDQKEIILKSVEIVVPSRDIKTQ
jgi:hypothetical protein